MNTDIKKVNRAFQLDQSDVSEVIQMALSDHIAFDDIFTQFGLKENGVRRIMRNNMKQSSFRMWRERVKGRKTKHTTSVIPNRFKSKNQNSF